MRLDKAFKSFFRRVRARHKPSFPRFKGRNGRIRSFDVPNLAIKVHVLTIKGIGRFRLGSMLDLKIRGAQFVETALHVCAPLIVEVGDSRKAQDAPIGIDMGLKHRAIISTGEIIDPVHLDCRGLKRKHGMLSRSTRASNTQRKKTKAVQREWERTRNRERNRIYGISASIVRRHNMIAVEGLQIGNMMRDHCIARSITQRQWEQLAHQLTCKAESAGGEVVEVDLRRTSMDRSVCGSRQAMPMSVRE